VFDLEAEVREWRNYLRARGSILESDVEELEGHLREEYAVLSAEGLQPDEAFLIAAKRIGNADALAREFAKVNVERLWKQLLVESDDPAVRRRGARDIALVVLLAVAAGVLSKLATLAGIAATPFGPHGVAFLRNLSFYILPPLAALLAVRRGGSVRALAAAGVPLLLALAAMNLYPFGGGDTEILTGIHAPILL
jgi:hypothetical protein